MSKKNVTIAVNAVKLSALEHYMAKKDARLTDELDRQFQSLYAKYVPPMVREYIDARSEPETTVRVRPPRSGA